MVGAFAEAAAPLGYVVVDAQRDLPEVERRRLWHRHIALVHPAVPTTVSLRWVRELAMASPRAHAVIAVTPQPECVREAALVDCAVSPMEWHRRRVVDGYAQMVTTTDVSPPDRVHRVITQGRHLLATVDSWRLRGVVVAAMADEWMSQGAFETATAALAAIEVECDLRGVSVPAMVRVRQAELACWLGEWDRAQACAMEAGHIGWTAVVRCARRDWTPLIAMDPPARWEAAPAVGPLWAAIVRVLSSAARQDSSAVLAAVRHLGALHQSTRGDRDARRWVDVLVLDAVRMVGADAAATDWISRRADRPRAPAPNVLWRHATQVAVDDHRLDAAGIRRWGMGRQHMQMWAGVASLLQQVQDADDAMAAMQQGCRWARDYTGVDAVAVVSETDGVLACYPHERRRMFEPPSGDDHEPVRYGGTQIARVVSHGAARDAAEARAVARALAIACAPAVRARLDDLAVQRAGDALSVDLIGVSPGMRSVRDAVARAAGSSYPVLIEGESGTGKELVARAVHRLSPRRDRRWAAVNCAALTDELLEAELFGHTKGAFTGAVGARAGLLEDAHEGTLFLDEVAELSPRGQAKLLRVLQEGEIRRVGENHARPVDVRVVAATNRPLDEAARQGTYREDLVFRLAVIRVRVPPLRDRLEDVPILAHAFWKATSARVSTRATLTPTAVAALCRYHWPGNVRELQNVIAALAVGGPTRGQISPKDVEAVLADRALSGGPSGPLLLSAARLLCDHRVVSSALARHAGRHAPAARELGVSRQGLAKLIRRLNLP
jgi:DNA-binding NtrC family response regulator